MIAPSTYTGPGSVETHDPTAVMGRRILAWIIDFAIYVGIAVGSFALLAEYSDVPPGIDADLYCENLQAVFPDEASVCFPAGDQVWLTSDSDSAVQLLLIVAYFVLFVVMQGGLGASFGKLVTGLRVVKADGTRAGFGRSLGRTIMWVIDGAPWLFPAVAFIVGLTSKGHRRVGDMAAGTYVIGTRDVGRPVEGDAFAAVVPPPPSMWDAPPPTGPPSAPPTGPPVGGPPPMSGVPPAAPAPPAVEELSPDISGVPADRPAPPPLVDDRMPSDEPPGVDLTPPEAPGMPPQAPAMPEIDGAVDESPPDVGVDPTWWEGPEAQPASEPPTGPEVAEPELPSWADPSTPIEDAGWQPPTTPGDDFGTAGDDPSPTAGPSPFVAPGADPVIDAPEAPRAAQPQELPPPQWDAARNTYIQWHPAEQKWLQWDASANRWTDIKL